MTKNKILIQRKIISFLDRRTLPGTNFKISLAKVLAYKSYDVLIMGIYFEVTEVNFDLLNTFDKFLCQISLLLE